MILSCCSVRDNKGTHLTLTDGSESYYLTVVSVRCEPRDFVLQSAWFFAVFVSSKEFMSLDEQSWDFRFFQWRLGILLTWEKKKKKIAFHGCRRF